MRARRAKGHGAVQEYGPARPSPGIAESADGVQRFPLVFLEGQSGHHATANSRTLGLATRFDAFCT